MADLDIRLKPVTIEGLNSVIDDRAEILSSLRTPYPLTTAHQDAFFKSLPNRKDLIMFNIVIDSPPNFGHMNVFDDPGIIGVGGLVNYAPENQIAELSVMINKEYHRKGYGTQAVNQILSKAKEMNIKNVYGETYYCSPALNFWTTVTTTLSSIHNVTTNTLKNRKKFNNKFYDSLYFNIEL
jgi:RimJ/RimL family protein N-acetyltransferase